MEKISLKTRLMNFCESFGPGPEFTWSQLHEFMVLETLAGKPNKTKAFRKEEVPEEYQDEAHIDTSFKNLVVLTYKECIDLYFKRPRMFRGFMSTPLANLGTWSDECGHNYMRRPSKNEPRYLVKNATGKYVLTRAA